MREYLVVFLVAAGVTYLLTVVAREIALRTGAVAAVTAMALRVNGMSQWIMWEMSGLFENIGTVQDGISSIAMPRLVEDKPGAKEIQVSQGGIEFDRIRFHYGKGKGVIENL